MADGETARERSWIDPHVHILPPRRMRGLVRWVKSFKPGFPSSEDITAEEVLAGIRAAGISLFFNLVFPLWPEETHDLNLYQPRLLRRRARGHPLRLPAHRKPR